MTYPNEVSADQLLQGDNREASMWLEKVWSGRRPVPAEFNWYLLAQGAAGLARTKLDLGWANLAVKVYDYIAAKGNASLADSVINSCMMLKAYMISELGVVQGDPILDVEPIVEWFLKSPDIAEAPEGIRPDSLNVDETRRLRRIKNRLAVIQVLADKDVLPPNVTLSAWLALRKQLP